MPESHEQWAAWGEDPIKAGSIERIGLNFGAPGDRKTRNGTLWLEYWQGIDKLHQKPR